MKKIIVWTLVILRGIMLIAELFVLPLCVLGWVSARSHETVSTDISSYSAECQELGCEYLMPPLDSLTGYTDLDYTHKVKCYSEFMGFYSDGLALFVQYAPDDYAEEKAGVLAEYDFLDAPVIDTDGDSILPVTEFDYQGFRMYIVPDPVYLSCKSFAMIGINDDARTIAYSYFYDADIDYIAASDEDPEEEMRDLMDSAFVWPEPDRLPICSTPRPVAVGALFLITSGKNCFRR